MEGDQDLNLSREKYVTGDESTVLHTIDIWKPEGSLGVTSSDNKLWLMWVGLQPAFRRFY